MKKFLHVLFGLFLAAPVWTDVGLPPPPPAVEAKASMLLDMSSGQVLAAQNPDQKIEPASLTKLMVAYLVFDAMKNGGLGLNDTFSVSEQAAAASGSRMFAKAGQKVTVDDLLSGLIIQSANDAALTLAEGMAKSEAAFVEKMNAQAKKLGLDATHFMNATGLPHPEHVSTARDMTRLAVLLIGNFKEQYKRYFSRRDFTFNGLAQQNRNSLLWLDPQVDGVKTGHTQSAGFSLIASAERNGRRLVSTVIGARTDANRAMFAQQLLNYGFLETESIRYYRAGQPVARVRVYKGGSNEIPIGFPNGFSLTFRKGVSAGVVAQIITRQPFVAPIRKGQVMGSLHMTLNGQTVGDYPLLALEDVAVAGWLGRFLDGLRLLWK